MDENIMMSKVQNSVVIMSIDQIPSNDKFAYFCSISRCTLPLRDIKMEAVSDEKCCTNHGVKNVKKKSVIVL